MKTAFKTSIKIVTVALLMALALLLVACGGGIDGIFFTKAPRNTVVLGQELDLDGAVLTALKGESKEPVDLSQVEITGFDKDTLGEQTVTFSYNGQSVTHKITVIPRISAEGVVTDYFVGDKFDKTKGRIKVADDKGNITTVNMSDERVTVDGFNSESAGKGKSVTVKYGEYTGTISVNVYEVASVEFTSKPKKSAYYSHDTEIYTLGSYFTVKSSDGALERMVELTQDMVTYFDPSVATVDNIDTPLEQTAKIEYLGNEFEFDITIRYSGVTYVQKIAAEIDGADAETAAKSHGADALLALGEYFKLSTAAKELVSSADKNSVVATAAVYGLRQLENALEAYEKTFGVSKTGSAEDGFGFSFNVSASSYDAVVADLENMKKSDSALNVIVSQLRPIKDEFKSVTVADGVKIDEYLATVFDEEAFDFLVDIFEVMVEMYEKLQVVPDDWKTENLDQYADEIKSTVVTISAGDYNPYTNGTYSTLYQIVSTWRKNDDMFDIIYAYYIEFEPENLVSELWEKVMLPGEMFTLYRMISYGLSETKSMGIGGDTTAFMYYYSKAIEISERIKSSDDELDKLIYDSIGFDGLINHYFFVGDRVNSYAYVYHVASLLDDPQYEEIMDNFLSIVHLLAVNKEIDYADSDVQAKIKLLLKSYVELTPAKRFAFISSIHLDYRYNHINELTLSYTLNDKGKISCYNLFAAILYGGYNEMLSDEGLDVFSKLMVATEMYALRYREKDRLNEFYTTMDEAIAAYANLAEADKLLLKDAYEDLVGLYDEAKAPANPDISEYQDKFDELENLINVFYEFYVYAGSEEVSSDLKAAFYTVAFAAYERAEKLVSELLATKNENVIHAYLHNIVKFRTDFDKDDEDENFEGTYDYMLQDMGALYHHFLVKASVYIPKADGDEDTYNAFDIYYGSQCIEFIELAFDIILAEARGDVSGVQLEQAISVVNFLSTLDRSDMFALSALSLNVLCFDGLIKYFEKQYSEEAFVVLERLINTIADYAGYIAQSSVESYDMLSETLSALKEAYDALADKSELDAFADCYSHFIESCDKILAEDIPEGGDSGDAPETTPDEDDSFTK